jgi:hypothetical protein
MKHPIKPMINKLNDGSILFEWCAKDCRFGISIEPNLKESTWYYVSRCPKQMLEGDYLPKEFVELLKEKE